MPRLVNDNDLIEFPWLGHVFDDLEPLRQQFGVPGEFFLPELLEDLAEQPIVGTRPLRMAVPWEWRAVVNDRLLLALRGTPIERELVVSGVTILEWDPTPDGNPEDEARQVRDERPVRAYRYIDWRAVQAQLGATLTRPAVFEDPPPAGP